MADAVRDERPWLLLPGPPCGFCRIRMAKVGDLCCACDDDTDAREQYAAQCAREETTE